MESGDEADDVSFGQKDWNRMEEKLHKEGYREGIERGKEENLQKYFDVTVAVMRKHSERIGSLIGSICHAIDSGPSDECAGDLKRILTDITAHMESIQKGTINADIESGNAQTHSVNDHLKCLERKWAESYDRFSNEFIRIQQAKVGVP